MIPVFYEDGRLVARHRDGTREVVQVARGMRREQVRLLDGYQLRSEKGAAHGYASLDASRIEKDDELATAGTPDSTTFLRGDRVWAVPPTGSGSTTDDAIWARMMGFY